MTIARLFIAGCLLTAACSSSAPAQGMPEQVHKALNRLVGEWVMESVVDGQASQADLTFEWSPDKAVLIYRFRGLDLISKAPTTGLGTLAWDGSAKTIREQSFDADGSTFEATHQIGSDPNTWDSPADGTFADGAGFTRYTLRRLVAWKSDDEFTLVSKECVVGGKPQPDISTVCRRVRSPAAQYFDFWRPLAGSWKTRAVVDGKTLLGTYSSQPAAGGNYYLSAATLGLDPASNSIDGYDPLTRTWKATGLNAEGGSMVLLVRIANLKELKTLQAGAKGTYETYRTLASGETETETGNWIFPSWDDQQRVLQLTGVTKNGRPHPDITLYYERQ